MARRTGQASAGVRRHLDAWLVELVAAYGDWPGCPFTDALARLRAGEPVVVRGYELDGLAGPVDPMGRFTVHADGSIVEVP
ncbi:MAG: hypothetical protein R2737_02010 [Candidatus Nanopelagicales bacterium]